MALRSTLAVAIVSLVSAIPASAQETPEAFVRRYLDALRAYQWMEVSDMMHPDEQGNVYRIFTPLLNAEGADDLREELLGVRSASAASRLTAQEVLARFLEYVTMQTGDVFATARIDVLGHVPEGDDRSHVVYRMHMTIQDEEISRVDVMSLRMSEDGWRGLMRQDLGAFERMLRSVVPDSTSGN